MGLSERLPPGSFGLPLIGETREFLADRESFLAERFARYGSIWKTRLIFGLTVGLGGRDGYALFNDPEYFTRVDASPPQLRLLFNPKSLSFMDGQELERRKSLIAEGFTRDRLGKYLPTIDALLTRYVENWGRMGRFEWGPDISRLSLGLIDCVFLGADPAVDKPELYETFDEVTSGVAAFVLSPAYGRALLARRNLDRYVRDVLRARHVERRADLISELIDAGRANGSTLSDEEIAVEVTHFFLAGAPLQSALAYHVLQLAQNPDAMARAREEVRMVTPSGPLTMKALGELKYVHRTCLESRRCARLVPLTFFAKVKKAFEFQGYHVPAGYNAIGLITATQHDERSVPRPERYDPQRFSKKRREAEGWHDGFIAHGGPHDAHRCSGEDFTSFVMAALTVKLLRAYTWSIPSQDLAASLGKVSPMPKDGLKVDFRQVP